MVLQPVDRNAHYRERRRKQRRRRQVRRAVAIVLLVLLAAAVAYAARVIRDDEEAAKQPERAAVVAQQGAEQTVKPLAPPKVMRGVHVTMALASIPGKIEEYLALDGINTIQLDIKDENGEVAFVPSSVPFAREIGAARPYYKPRQILKKIHDKGIYVVGRIVVMEDPVLSRARPDMAIRTRDGSRWLNHAGLGWANPYDKRVWEYNADLAEVAARLGFDEIQLDYVRFPSDGDMENIVFPTRTSTPKGWVIPQFVQYVSQRLKPLGVRLSADVFGLSATRDLGIGQIPRRMARYLDAIYPMVYPSHYGPGEYGLDDPNAQPGATIAYSLRDFNRELARTRTRIIPWLQDFSLGRTYTLADIQDQIDAARRAKADGYLLWNAAGVYTPGALDPQRWQNGVR